MEFNNYSRSDNDNNNRRAMQPSEMAGFDFQETDGREKETPWHGVQRSYSRESGVLPKETYQPPTNNGQTQASSHYGGVIENNPQELANALLETLQKLVRPQPTFPSHPDQRMENMGTGYETHHSPTAVPEFGSKDARFYRNHTRVPSLAPSIPIRVDPSAFGDKGPVSAGSQTKYPFDSPRGGTGYRVNVKEQEYSSEDEPFFSNSRDASLDSKREYLIALAKALLSYGAPTHRVEAYMVAAARCLALPSKFFYLPDHFIISFDDNQTYKSEFQLVQAGGTNLGKFEDAHEVYKLVNHDLISVDEGLYRLQMIERQPPRYSHWFLLIIYGFAAVGIGPFAYRARFIDLPILFGMGMILGFFQLKFVPNNKLYHIVFEISTAIFMSFLGRMFGSIRSEAGNHIFCYSAITQGSINLILPGYWITNASLELMNHQLASGGTRMMHAFIYFLFLGYGIAIGSALYGFIDPDAVSSPVCVDVIDRHWNLFFVPFFSIQVAIISGAKLRQIIPMVFITFCSYSATFVTVNIFNGSFTFANTIGGFVIGVLGNLYARVGAQLERTFGQMFSHTSPDPSLAAPSVVASQDAAERGMKPGSTTPAFTLAAAAMVPAMIVQVPSGLSAVGAVLTGLTTADAIVRNDTTNALTAAPAGEIQLNGLPVLLNVVQIGISIGFGLSIATLLTYTASGNKRSGIMSW